LTTTNAEIVKIIDECIERLCNDFSEEPTLYYTENDLICRLYWQILQKLEDPVAQDNEKQSHLLLHTEYSTPFKCYMKGGGFEAVGDNEKNRKCGHYDLIVLNPDFVKSHSYSEIFGQDFETVKNRVRPWSAQNGPFILYGIEVMLKRKWLPLPQKTGRHGTLDTWMEKLDQDYLKLEESKKRGFMLKSKAILFVRETSEEAIQEIRKRNSDPDSIVMCIGREVTRG